MPTADFLTWLNLTNKQRVYQGEATLRFVSGGSVQTEQLNVSTHGINTTTTETPANTPYHALLGRASIPPLRQEIALPFRGAISKVGYGTVSILRGSILSGKLPPTREWEGGRFDVYLAGRRRDLALSNRELIFRGVMGKPQIWRNHIETEIFTRHRELEQKEMLAATFTNTAGEVVLAPEAFGFCNNVTPPLKDATTTTNIIYKVAGHELEDIVRVMDKGVALTLTTQWTKDLVNGEFALKQKPAGLITCDVKGRKFGAPATFSAKRGDFIKWALENPGGIAAADLLSADFTVFNTDVPQDSGIYISEQTTVMGLANLLLEPVIGFLTEDRAGKFSIGTLKLPAGTPALTLNPQNLLPLDGSRTLVKKSQVDTLLYKIALNYDENNSVQDSGTLGDAAPIDRSTQAGRERIEWLSKRWRGAERKLTGATQGRSLYPTAGEMTLDSYLINKVDAETWGDKWLTLFGVSRFFYEGEAKVQPVTTKLHDVARFTDGTGEIVNLDARIIMYLEDYQQNRIRVTAFV